MKRRFKQGFTLAEVLITLAVIGVVAAMSIPALIGTTNQQEFKVGLKKAVAVLNQAITMSIALDSETAADCGNCSAASPSGAIALQSYFKNRLNVIANGPDDNSFYTADGMLFRFVKRGAAGDVCTNAVDDTTDWTAANCSVYVDVNGSKGPNKESVGSEAATAVYRDQYWLVVGAQNVVPGGLGGNTIAQDAMSY